MPSLNVDVSDADARFVADERSSDLLACVKVEEPADPLRPLVQTWIDWRRRALDALPPSLRDDSDHQRAIDETYRRAIRGFLSEEVAVTYDPEGLDIISRPPVGGYDIGGVGFTDIDETSEEPASASSALLSASPSLNFFLGSIQFQNLVEESQK